jgi:hypothetical protein
MASGQVKAVQYWFDSNFSGHTALITENQTVQITELNTGALPAGIHQLHIRAKATTEDGDRWSVVHSQVFYQLPALAANGMTDYEFWADNDFAGRKPGTLSGASGVIADFDVNDYPAGIHVLHVRAKDSRGNYSPVHSQVFYKLPALATANNMTAYECWVDNGFAARKPGTLSGTSGVIADFDANDYPAGIHVLHLRARDSRGNYSPVHSQVFYKLPDVAGHNSVSNYEYWVDNDFANRTSVAASGETLLIADPLDMSLLSEGIHVIHTRAKDSRGHWSGVHAQPFYANGIAPEDGNRIDAYRYWYDNQFDEHVFSLVDEAVNPYKLEESYTLPATFSEGEEHAFHIQFRDALGKWSTVASDTFKIVSASGSGIEIVPVNSVLLYPNPAREGFFIKGLPDAEALVVMIDATGKNALEQPLNNTAYVDIRTLPSGVYTVKLFLRNGTMERKMIKR